MAYQDFITLFCDYGTLIVGLILISKIVDIIGISGEQRRIVYGSAVFISASFAYLFQDIWFEWVSHTEKAQKYFLNGLGTVWWLSIAYTFSNSLHYFVWRGILGRGSDSAAPKLVRDFIDVVLYAATIMLILRLVYNQPITGVLATSGALAIVLGLSAQATLGGVFAGLSMNLSNSFEKGDTVIISNVPSGIKEVRGVIVDMNWRNVTILTKFNNYLIMPNSLMASSAITNYSKPEPKRMMEMWVIVPYHVSPQTAKEIIARAIDHSPHILKEPKPKVQLANFEDSGIRYRFELWTLRPGSDSIRDDVLTAIWYEFHRNRINLHPAHFEMRDSMSENQNSMLHYKSEQTNLITKLRKIEILTVFTEEELELLASRVQRKIFGPPERIVIEGQEGDSMFFIESGRVAILIKQPDGNQLKVAELTSGSFFGEMALLTGEKRKATVTALNEVTLFEISKDDLLPILEKRQEILQDIGRILATRQVENAAKVAQYSENIKTKETEIATTTDKLVQLMKNFFSRKEN
ncbi:MAG: mechanosensitive ion channel family protein [Cytophagales bacterium]|nr:mechanosensitive ion channel family protein [Cytophagales bacterium]MDW8383412.1 mechanosensitive ion channel family protein [Flammeovirgaceae bacterium]